MNEYEEEFEMGIWFRFFWQNRSSGDLNMKDTTLSNFQLVQSIRFVMLISLLLLWFTLFYTLVRYNFSYLSFYAMSLLIASMLFVSFSAGRLVVEEKMLAEQNKEKKQQWVMYRQSEVYRSDVQNNRELPANEKSNVWRPAIILYSLALPYVWISSISFYWFTGMRDSVLCQMAHTGDPENILVQTCRDDSKYSRELLITAASWRWTIYQASMVIMPLFTIIEFCLNKIKPRLRHAVLVFPCTLIYLVINAIAEDLQDGVPVYQDTTVWWSESHYEPDEYDVWADLLYFLVVFVGGSVFLSLVFTMLHRWKAKCCKRQQREDQTELIGI